MGRHHSSGPQEKGLRQQFRPFFGRIGGEDPKKRSSSETQTFFERIGGEGHKKRFSPGDENNFGGLLMHIYH